MRVALASGLLASGLVACNALVGWGDLQEVNEPASNPQIDGGSSGKADGATSSSSSSGSNPDVDAGPRCDPSKDFGAPVPIAGPINTVSAHEGSPTLTPDELTMIFQRSTSGSAGALLVSRRNTVNDAWQQPTELTEFASVDTITDDPSMTGSALDIYFGEVVSTQRAQIFHASRATPQSQFGGTAIFDPVASSASDNAPFITSDGAELFFLSNRADGLQHVFRSIRSPGGNYKAPEQVSELVGETGSFEVGAVLTFDKLTMFFSSTRSPASASNPDVFTAHRATVDSEFDDVAPLTSVNSSAYDIPSWISQDNCVLYMTRLPNGPGDIYVATRGK